MVQFFILIICIHFNNFDKLQRGFVISGFIKRNSKLQW